MLTLTKKLRREQESKEEQARSSGEAFESNNNEVLAAQQRVKRVSVRDRLLVKEVRFLINNLILTCANSRVCVGPRVDLCAARIL